MEGCVRQPVEWTWEELAALPERSVFATVECAGNGRSFLQKREPGVQWGAGAIGHAEWTGVPLYLVLERSGLEPGGDRNRLSREPTPAANRTIPSR